MKRQLSLMLILFCSFCVLIACSDSGSGGGGGNWCPGEICSNCATNCPTLDCPPDKMNACVGGSYFDADPELRCAFCTDR